MSTADIAQCDLVRGIKGAHLAHQRSQSALEALEQHQAASAAGASERAAQYGLELVQHRIPMTDGLDSSDSSDGMETQACGPGVGTGGAHHPDGMQTQVVSYGIPAARADGTDQNGEVASEEVLISRPSI